MTGVQGDVSSLVDLDRLFAQIGAGFLYSRSLDQSSLFEAIEQRIQRVDVEREVPARSTLDQRAQFVATSERASSSERTADPFFNSRSSARVLISVRDYSYLRAVTGSTAVARRAGP